MKTDSVIDVALEAVVGASEILDHGDGWIPSRLPTEALAQCTDPGPAVLATMPVGVRISAVTDSPFIEIDTHVTRYAITADQLQDCVCELFVDDERFAATECTGGDVLLIDQAGGSIEHSAGPSSTVRFEGLPGRAGTRIELWLPHNAVVKLKDVRVSAGSTFRAVPDELPVWAHYGSSISHSLAHRPTDRWPVQVARRAGVSLRDFSFAGNCQLDQFAARAIRSVEASAISCKVGINVLTEDSMRERTFAPAFHGFLDTIRDTQPTTPLLVVTPIYFGPGEQHPGPARTGADGMVECVPRSAALSHGALTLSRMRNVISDAVARRQADGDDNLHVLDGLQLLGAEDERHLADRIHPDANGDRLIADRFYEAAFGPSGPLDISRVPRKR